MINVTVIVPTRNRCRSLADLLGSLREQQPAGISWEVLVVDNGSTDDTSVMMESIKADFPVPLRYIYEPNPGLHNCRNRGALEAESTAVAFLDDDMILDKLWIKGARLVLEEQASMVGGRILPLWEAQAPDWIKHLFY